MRVVRFSGEMAFHESLLHWKPEVVVESANRSKERCRPLRGSVAGFEISTLVKRRTCPLAYRRAVEKDADGCQARRGMMKRLRNSCLLYRQARPGLSEILEFL